MVERQLPKLHTGVRFPSSAPFPKNNENSCLRYITVTSSVTVRYRASVTSFDARKGVEDMRCMLKRGAYYVRFNAPKDRMQDVERVL